LKPSVSEPDQPMKVVIGDDGILRIVKASEVA